MKKTRVLALVLLVALLAGAAWLYWPHPLENLINWQHSLQVIAVSGSVQEDATTRLGSASYVLAPGSAEHSALKALLAGFRWHRGLGSLCQDGMTGVKTNASLQLVEMSAQGPMLEVAQGTGRMAHDGKAARIGWFGAGDADKLVAGIHGIIAPLSPEPPAPQDP